VPWRNSTLSATDICEYTHVVFLVCGYYIFYIEDFHKFIETVLLPAEALKPSLRIINHPSIVLWNSNKTYLQELEKEGFPVPHTQYFNATQSLKSLELAVGSHASHGPVVLKPSVSASGRSTHLIKDPSNLTEDDRNFLLDITQLPQRGSIMLQDYIPDIKHGEYSLVFINGSMISSFLKMPAGEEFRVQEEYGGFIKPVQKSAVPESAVKIGEQLWTYLTVRFPDKELVYARIDGVVKQDGSFVLIGKAIKCRWIC